MGLPEGMLGALVEGKINEGHTRPLLMLADRPAEQLTVFQEIMVKKMTVREAEGVARRIAFDRVRKEKYILDPNLVATEQKLTEQLGTRVQIERKEIGGKVIIDFISSDDLNSILALLSSRQAATPAPDPLGEQTLIEDAVAPAVASEDELYNLQNFSI